MLTAMVHINWLAVAAATLISFLLGGLWFAVLFARLYSVAMGREHDPKASHAPRFILGPLVCNLVMITTSAILIGALHITTTGPALLFGAIVGLGYCVSTMVNISINPNFPRPMLYAAINAPTSWQPACWPASS